MKMNNRLLLYVHFNSENRLSKHVIYQLRHLRLVFGKILFISNSPLAEEDKNYLKENNLLDDFIQRENKGYDFLAWSEAMKFCTFEKLSHYDSVTLMNDTCFGPVFDLEPIFSKFENNDDIDFWGITNNRSHTVNPYEDGDEEKDIILPGHIQSYFISFKQNVVQSETFKNFWENIELLDDVVWVIIRYETAVTKYFEDAGFKSDVLFDTREEDWTGMLIHDFSVFNLSSLIERRIPFLKIKAFVYGAEDVYTPLIIEKLKQISDYPVENIINYMTWKDYPDRPYMLDEKLIDFKEVKSSEKHIRVGIHLHVFYVDLLKEFLNNFDKFIKNYDLFITTDSDLKKKEIERLIGDNEKVKKIIRVDNVGRDILPWTKVAKELSTYDIAGHFHTKASKENYWIVGESWRQDIVDNLLYPAQQIFAQMDAEPNIGLVISNVPSFFKNFRGPLYMDEEEIWPKMKLLWEKINFEKKRKLIKKDSYVMSYGTMLWYRPKALENLLNVAIDDEVPKEPLPYDSILHAYERIIVYTAWANGYDFRIAKIKNGNDFFANISLNRVLREVEGDKENPQPLETKLRLKEIVQLFFKKIKFMIQLNYYNLRGKRGEFLKEYLTKDE